MNFCVQNIPPAHSPQASKIGGHWIILDVKIYVYVLLQGVKASMLEGHVHLIDLAAKPV